MIPAPLVDERGAPQVVAQLRALFRADLPEWPRPALAAWPAGDPGAALVEIFGRLSEIAIERLNLAPERHFLAFLEMLGVTLLAPAAARAPVQFFLATGAAADALVRRETPLATAGTSPLAFETERDLWVSRSSVVRALTYDPRRDRHTDHSAGLAGAAGLQPPFAAGESAPPAAAVQPFVGTTLLDHILYLGQDAVLGGRGPVRVAVELFLKGTATTAAIQVLSSLGWFVRTAAGGARRLAAFPQALGLPLPGTFTVDGNVLTGSAAGFAASLAPGDRVMVPLRGLVEVVQVLAPNQVLVSGAPPTVFLRSAMSGFRVDAERVAGTVHTAGSSTRLLGSGTSFSLSVRVGDRVLIAGVPEPRRIAAIVDAQQLDLDAAVEVPDASGVALWRLLRDPLPGGLAALVELDQLGGAEPFDVAGVGSRWLWAKTERPLLGDAAAFPPVGAVRVASVAAEPVSPDAALSNGTALDLGKGGFPFGERPKLGDILYLASAEVLSRAGARVMLTVDLQFPINPSAEVRGVSLAWEYWSGASWASIGTTTSQLGVTDAGSFNLEDDSAAFTSVGSRRIRFDCPAALPVSIGGQTRLWVRARLASGDYGEDARLVPRVPNPASLGDWNYQPATFRPPFITGMRLDFEYQSAQPASALAVKNAFALTPIPLDANTQQPLEPFSPFPPPEDADPALALGFDLAFANHPVSLFLAVAEQTEPPANAEVRWSYWNGTAWAPLGIVRDETKSFTEPGALELLGPLDLARSSQLGGDLFWIRAELRQGEPPLFGLDGIWPNTTWAANAVTVRDELIGSSNGKPGQVFTASRNPVLEGVRLEVRELEAPPADEIAALVDEGETDPVRIVRDRAGRPSEIWVRWHEVDHFQLSGPHSRHYVVDRGRGRFIMGNGRRGRIPPPGRDNVRLAEYRAGGGQAGNVGAGTITVIKRAVPSVDRVTNPAAAGGGADLEDVEAVKDRGPLLLRHRDRAVTAEDYEALARRASRQVARAKCLPARDAATAGKVAVLIVPSGGPRPLPTPGLLRQVKTYLDARRLPTADLSLFGPRYVDVSVTAQVVPASFDDADLVRQRVADVLTAWLHPLTGGPDGKGWAFGRDVYFSEVAATIESIDGVDHLVFATLAGTADGEDRARDGGRRIEVREELGELVASGAHFVSLST